MNPTLGTMQPTERAAKPNRHVQLFEYVRAKGFLWFVFIYGGVFVAGTLFVLSVVWFAVSLWYYGPSAPRPAWVESPFRTLATLWLVCVVLAGVAWPVWLLWSRITKRHGA